MSVFKKGYKYRIYPTPDQVVFLEKTLGCCRKVWNELLARTTKQYELYKSGQAEKPKLNSFSLINQTTLLKREPEFSYLNEVSSKALQTASSQLGEAYRRFFDKKANYPKFKKKTERGSFTLPFHTGNTYFGIKDGKLTVSKLDQPIEVRWTRELPSHPSQVTISKTPSGKYYASFLCDASPRMTYGQGIAGVDLGIAKIATMSKGLVLDNPRHYLNSQKRLAALSRRLSKKQKGSKNRQKARLKVAKLHEHIANQRCDFLHKLTRRLVNDNQVVVIEDLNVKGMSKNRKLSKHILDAGFGMFRRFLEYKAVESQWCRVLVADRFEPSTQKCSACGKRPKEKIKLGVKKWTCAHCRTEHDRDVNASKNLEQIAYRYPDLWQNNPGKIIKCKPYQELIGS